MVQFRKQRLPQEEYVFFFIDLFGESVQGRPAKPWAQGDADDDVVKEAFKVSQLLMSGLRSKDMKREFSFYFLVFATQCVKQHKTEPFISDQSIVR